MAIDSKANILTEVRAMLNEPSAVFWSDTNLNAWIDLGALDLSTKTLCFEATDNTSVTFVAGTMEYTIPTSLIKTIAVQYNGVGLLRIYPEQIAHVTATSSGAPQFFYEFADKLGFYPVPDATAVAAEDNPTIKFAKQTTDITDIPIEIRQFVLPFVCFMAKQAEGNYQQANFYYTQYANSLSFHRKDLFEKSKDTKDIMKITDRQLAPSI